MLITFSYVFPMMIFGRSFFLGIGENIDKESLYFLLYLIVYGLTLLCIVVSSIKWILKYRISKKTLFLILLLLTIHIGIYFFSWFVYQIFTKPLPIG